MLDAKNIADAAVARSSGLPPLVELKRASRWLSEYSGNVTSQTGEDGIVAKALSLLPNPTHWCVEFGAWDGRLCSNTYDLVDRHQYNVVLIEGDSGKYGELCSTYPHKDRAIFVNAFVGWSAKDGLDQILGQHPIPKDFDLLSVDVDGNDYNIWRATEKFQPKLVLVEYNFTIANSIEFAQSARADCCQGSSAAALVKLAREKGYELIAVTKLNLLFVHRTFYPLFGIPDNSLEVMRDEEPNHVFFGYDGTVFLAGRCRLEWHPGWELSERKMQLLPNFLRKHPPDYTFVQRQLLRIFFMLNHPKEGLSRMRRYFKRSVGG